MVKKKRKKTNYKKNTKQDVKVQFSKILPHLLNTTAKRNTASHLFCIFLNKCRHITKMSQTPNKLYNLIFFPYCILSIFTYQ